MVVEAIEASPESASKRRFSIPPGSSPLRKTQSTIMDLSLDKIDSPSPSKLTASKRRYSLPSGLGVSDLSDLRVQTQGDAKALNERLAIAQKDLLNSPKSERKSGVLKERCDALESAILEIHEAHAARQAPEETQDDYSHAWLRGEKLGLSFSMKDGWVIVSHISPDSPAGLENLKGWMLMLINGEVVHSPGQDTVPQVLKRIEALRGGGVTLSFSKDADKFDVHAAIPKAAMILHEVRGTLTLNGTLIFRHDTS